jgi:hypothetical protein
MYIYIYEYDYIIIYVYMRYKLIIRRTEPGESREMRS